MKNSLIRIRFTDLKCINKFNNQMITTLIIMLNVTSSRKDFFCALVPSKCFTREFLFCKKHFFKIGNSTMKGKWEPKSVSEIFPFSALNLHG